MDFKVKCTARNKREDLFTVGKIYEVKDGKLCDDQGNTFRGWSMSHNGNADFEALRKWFESFYTFELVKQTPKYKVGDKVRVRKDLDDRHGCYHMDNSNHHGWVAIGSMLDLRGKVVTITDYSEMQECYFLTETEGLKWTDEMFVGLVTDYKIGDKVIVECSNIEYISKYAGKTGVIKNIWHSSYGYDYEVEFENGVRIWCKVKCLAPENNTVDNKKVEDNAMKVNKFKVGDRVIVGESNVGNKWAGEVGVIDEIYPTYAYPYRVIGTSYGGGLWCKVTGYAHKFKVGDKVVGNDPDRYSITRLGWKGVVTRVRENGRIDVKGCGNTLNNNLYTYLETKYFDLNTESDQKIVITHDGKTTTATMYCEDGTKKVATARCAPEDEFDFTFGAKLAMERLMESVENSKWKVVVVTFKQSKNRTYSYKTKDLTAKVGMEIEIPVGAYNRKLVVTVTEVVNGDEYKGEYPISEW